MPVFEIISLKEWWNGEESNKNAEIHRLPVIDIREPQEDGQRLRHGESITVVHLPLRDLQSGERSCELPPRHVPFAILTKEDLLEAARDFFRATTSRVTSASRKPWLVEQVLLANDELWRDANEIGILQVKEDVIPNSPFQPLPRLWQPDPMVQYVLWPLLKERRSLSIHQQEEVWDLGSGAGRDVCFLAENSKSLGIDSYRFVGIDHHKASAKRCLPFWFHRHIEDRTEARSVDLSKIDRVQKEIEGRDIACLYAVRFWNAKLIQFIADNTTLAQGTLFAMSHFCKPYPGAPWNFDHPKVRLFTNISIRILVASF